jgi:hypothetical protein
MATATGVGRSPVVVNILKTNIANQPRTFVSEPHIGVGKPSVVSQVKWTNGTGGRAWLWFPNGDRIFSSSNNYLNPIEIPSSGLSLDVKADPVEGAYHYHIYCETVHDCAQGNSEPTLSVP